MTDERLREEHVTDERLREEHVTDERLREEHVTRRSHRSGESLLTPRFIDGDGGGVGQVQ